MISKDQHGFLSGHSSTTNLLECLKDWTALLENGSCVKVLYYDFKKAFDTVSVPKLLLKLEYLGIGGNLLSCIDSFLSNRSQIVRVGHSFSESKSVISGVPQGSVLGPLLFLLYINDLPNTIDSCSRSKLFADDLKSYNTIDYCIYPKVSNDALSAVVAWSKIWQLSLASSKCGSLFLHGKKSHVDNDVLVIDGSPLFTFDTVKDLGVLIDTDLSFSPHIKSIVSKAKQRIYLMFKSFHSRDVALFVFAYKTYILPILDYNSPIWSPYKLSDIDKLEDVQRFYTKRLKGLWYLSYKQRLVACNLVSLELRRLIL